MLPPSAVLPGASGAQTHKIGISMRVAQLEPLMDSLGIPTELRNKQSPKDELPEFSQQLHREKKSTSFTSQPGISSRNNGHGLCQDILQL